MARRAISWLPDRVAEMLGVFREVGADYMLQGREGVWTTQAGLDRMCARLASEGRLTDSLREVLIDNVTIDPDPPLDRIAKATFSSEHHGTYGAVKARLGEEFMVITGTMPGLGTAGGEVSVAGSDRRVPHCCLGHRRARARPSPNSIAIGDNNNDLEMLRRGRSRHRHGQRDARGARGRRRDHGARRPRRHLGGVRKARSRASPTEPRTCKGPGCAPPTAARAQSLSAVDVA